MPSRFEDRDHGYRAFVKSIFEAGRGFKVTVGIHAEEGSEIVKVATINEFGAPDAGIPARPSITAWADEKGDKALQRLRDETADAIKARKNPVQRADQLAQVFAGEIQGMISEGVPPPNAESTIAKKGSSTPLINTGQFRSSIRGKAESK